MEDHEFAELNPLQIFLLVLVELGLATPYDLLSKAGLGPGLTSPALKRLQGAGLLTSTAGPRNRVRYAITEKGADQLRESLKPGMANYWQLGQTDIFESLPRGIILAWLHGGVDEAHQGTARGTEMVSIVARRRERDAEELRESMNRLQSGIVKDNHPATKGMLIGTVYQWIKAECDAALYRLQAEAIGKIDQLLVELPPASLARGEKENVW